MDDRDEIGRPNYSADRATNSAPARPTMPAVGPAGATGRIAFRARAIAAAALAACGWAWNAELLHIPMWVTLGTAGAAIRQGRIARASGGSVASVIVSNAAWLAGAGYLAYAVPAALLTMQQNGVVALLNLLLSSQGSTL